MTSVQARTRHPEAIYHKINPSRRPPEMCHRSTIAEPLAKLVLSTSGIPNACHDGLSPHLLQGIGNLLKAFCLCLSSRRRLLDGSDSHGLTSLLFNLIAMSSSG